MTYRGCEREQAPRPCVRVIAHDIIQTVTQRRSRLRDGALGMQSSSRSAGAHASIQSCCRAHCLLMHCAQASEHDNTGARRRSICKRKDQELILVVQPRPDAPSAMPAPPWLTVVRMYSGSTVGIAACSRKTAHDYTTCVVSCVLACAKRVASKQLGTRLRVTSMHDRREQAGACGRTTDRRDQ